MRYREFICLTRPAAARVFSVKRVGVHSPDLACGQARRHPHARRLCCGGGHHQDSMPAVCVLGRWSSSQSWAQRHARGGWCCALQDPAVPLQVGYSLSERKCYFTPRLYLQSRGVDKLVKKTPSPSRTHTRSCTCTYVVMRTLCLHCTCGHGQTCTLTCAAMTTCTRRSLRTRAHAIARMHVLC